MRTDAAYCTKENFLQDVSRIFLNKRSYKNFEVKTIVIVWRKKSFFIELLIKLLIFLSRSNIIVYVFKKQIEETDWVN